MTNNSDFLPIKFDVRADASGVVDIKFPPVSLNGRSRTIVQVTLKTTSPCEWTTDTPPVKQKRDLHVDISASKMKVTDFIYYTKDPFDGPAAPFDGLLDKSATADGKTEDCTICAPPLDYNCAPTQLPIDLSSPLDVQLFDVHMRLSTFATNQPVRGTLALIFQ
jgi:hypothetical protein